MPDWSGRPNDARHNHRASRHKLVVAVVFVLCVLGSGGARVAAQHGLHPPMPDQKYAVYIRPAGGDAAGATEVALDIATPTSPSDLTQEFVLPNGGGVLRAVRYLPRAAVEQTVEPDEGNGTGSAILLSIEGPSQSFERWLLAGDADRNRLESLIGTWRYMAPPDGASRNALYAQFETELTRDPMLQIRSDSQSLLREFAAIPGHVERLPEKDCTLEVLKFLPHFAIDDKTKSPVSLSEKRLNPAAQIRFSCGKKITERWLFTRFPEFNPGGEDPLPVRISLDCPVDAERPIPAFVIVTTEGTKHEAWERFGGKTTAKPLMPERAVAIANSSYSFRVRDFVRSGRLVETYKPDEGRRAVPAVRFQLRGAKGGDESFWIAAGRNRVIKTPGGRVLVGLGAQQAASIGGHP